MRTDSLTIRLVLVCVLCACALTSAPLRAQDTPLAAAFATRRPPNEIVAQVCPGNWTFVDDFVCARGADGAVRAFRRVGLGGYVSGARSGDDVIFVVSDGATETRFAGYTWRWDLAGDVMRGLGELGHVEGEEAPLLISTTFGVIYRTTAGVILHDGTRGRAVAVPEGLEDARVFVHDGVTYGTWVEDDAVEVRSLSLHGDRVQWQLIARLAGHAALRHGPVVVTERTHVRTTDLEIVVLPGSAVTAATVRLTNVQIDVLADGSAVRVYTGARAFTVDVASGIVSPLETGPTRWRAPARPPTPRALVRVDPGEAEVWLRARASHGVALSAAGVSVRRRGPRPRTTCACRGADMVCGRSGPTVTGACPATVQTAEIVEHDHDRARAAPSFTGDGRFRIDRMEADVVRITRLADGARLWARLFGDATLLAQRDDGTYFLSDRSLESGFIVRLGASLLEAPTAALTSRADLYRETLVADFFAGR